MLPTPVGRRWAPRQAMSARPRSGKHHGTPSGRRIRRGVGALILIQGRCRAAAGAIRREKPRIGIDAERKRNGHPAQIADLHVRRPFALRLGRHDAVDLGGVHVDQTRRRPIEPYLDPARFETSRTPLPPGWRDSRGLAIAQRGPPPAPPPMQKLQNYAVGSAA